MCTMLGRRGMGEWVGWLCCASRSETGASFFPLERGTVVWSVVLQDFLIFCWERCVFMCGPSLRESAFRVGCECAILGLRDCGNRLGRGGEIETGCKRMTSGGR